MSTANTANYRLNRQLRRLGWNKAPSESLRRRLYASTGHANRGFYKLVMNLTGREWCGSYDVPKGRDLYFRQEGGQGKFRTTHNFREMHESNRDGEWRSFNIQNDGFELHMGYVDPETGNVRGTQLDRHELRLLVRWLLGEYFIRGEWFGLRRWIYYRALHAYVSSFQRRGRKAASA